MKMCFFIPWVKKMKQKSLKFNSIDVRILTDFCTKNDLFFGRGIVHRPSSSHTVPVSHGFHKV